MPVPGGPTSRMPRGMCAPSRVELVGLLQEVDDLVQLVLRLVDAGDVGERDASRRSRRPAWRASGRPTAARRRSRRTRRPRRRVRSSRVKRTSRCRRTAAAAAPRTAACRTRRAPAVAENSTWCFARSPARSAGTWTVVKLSLPSGSFSDSVPRSVSPDTTTLVTLPSFSNCWNWLYGMGVVPVPWLVSSVTVAAPISASVISQSGRGFGCLAAGTGRSLRRFACRMSAAFARTQPHRD